MPALSDQRIGSLLEPYLQGKAVPEALMSQLSVYLDLLMRWNGRTNLTAIREPEAIVQRHFGESLFAGGLVAERFPETTTLLDLGSGAGFPGLPIQLLMPDLAVTLAESQNKKASFLREAVRTLGLRTEVWGGRAEDLGVERKFSIVALRAVDHMEQALAIGAARVADGGLLMSFSTFYEDGAAAIPEPSVGWISLRKL